MIFGYHAGRAVDNGVENLIFSVCYGDSIRQGSTDVFAFGGNAPLCGTDRPAPDDEAADT